MKNYILHTGDCLDVLRGMDENSVQCVVTSPPYWGLRDYGVDGQLGLEDSLDKYLTSLAVIFNEVNRILKKDGTLWVNLGDSYTGAWQSVRKEGGAGLTKEMKRSRITRGGAGLKNKDLVGIPWRVAFELRSAGWFLRSDIIWAKPNPKPESVRDRPTLSHEYLFLLAKSEKYYYDADAIKEKPKRVPNYGFPSSWAKDGDHSVLGHNIEKVRMRRADKKRGHDRRHAGFNDCWDAMTKEEQTANGANKRSVWNIPTQPFPEAHFATFPVEIPTLCIRAGSRPGDIILDPFSGSGTTGVAACILGRKYIGIDINPEYIEMADRRIDRADRQGLLDGI